MTENNTLDRTLSAGQRKKAARHAARKRAFVKAKQAREDRARGFWERMEKFTSGKVG